MHKGSEGSWDAGKYRTEIPLMLWVLCLEEEAHVSNSPKVSK